MARQKGTMTACTANLAMNMLGVGELDTIAAANDPTDDGALARASARGDSRAFEMLYRRHASRVYGLCVRLVDGDRAKAESLAQDAFVRAWEKIGSFRGEAQFSTWLHRLTVNVVLGEHRLLKRWVSFDDHADANAGDDEAFASHPQANVGLKMDLERALARLPKGARTVLMLHDIEGYKHEEIAELTGIAVGTSKAQLHRARKLMREHLQ
jgi:RNA polymerase sigma factor (sigma-70 family)